MAAFAFSLIWIRDDIQPGFAANLIADLLQNFPRMFAAIFADIERFVIVKIRVIEDNMIMDMVPVYMRCEDILILPFQESFGKLNSDLVCLLRRCFIRQK